MRSRQIAERLGVEEAHMLEFQQFNIIWDKKMAEYEQHAADLRELAQRGVLGLLLENLELPRALELEMAQRISEAIKPLGFRFVSLDLDGYRSGSLNEVLFIRDGGVS